HAVASVTYPGHCHLPLPALCAMTSVTRPGWCHSLWPALHAVASVTCPGWCHLLWQHCVLWPVSLALVIVTCHGQHCVPWPVSLALVGVTRCGHPPSATPCPGQGHLPPAQVAPSPLQPALEPLQGWGSHS
uniref:Uncharacterized protein n=1 Tax=Calidris pygmaea TaxID=425635 RepID=A0A8C3K7E4_9CHAR